MPFFELGSGGRIRTDDLQVMSLTSTFGTSALQALEIEQPCDLWFQLAWRVMVLESIIHHQPSGHPLKGWKGLLELAGVRDLG